MKKTIVVTVIAAALTALSVSAQAPAPSVTYSERRSVTARGGKVVANIEVVYMSDGSVRWEQK